MIFKDDLIKAASIYLIYKIVKAQHVTNTVAYLRI